MAVVGITRAGSYVDVEGDEVRVRLGWGFHAVFPRASVRATEPDDDPVWGWGAHGWRGRWLVNGSSTGLVRIELDPEARGHVLGFPVGVSVLRVSVEDPDALIAELDPR
jgi:hypothetical protein